MGEHLRWLCRHLCDFGEDLSDDSQALLRERYSALQRQIPWLYGIILANVLGLHLATRGSLDPLRNPATLLILAAIIRLAYWMRVRSSVLSAKRIRNELRTTFVFSGTFSLLFCLWANLLFSTGDDHQQNYVILFSSLAAVGCAYGLSSFPSAGRLPLLLLALPLALRLVLSDEAAHVGMGISLVLLTFTVLRLLSAHNKGFAQLVHSRSEVERERERAQAAERIANDEKARVRKVADTDPLTGLANRRAFLAELQAAAAEARRGTLALALIDLDGFKPINDTFGHAAGDAVLMEVSARLRKSAGAKALVARMGGDEFALLLRCRGKAAAERIGKRVCASLQQTYRVGDREFRISGSCGITVHAAGESDLSSVLRRGDIALYRAKQEGRGKVAIFSSEMEAGNRRRIAIERALRDPAIQNSIWLEYQPIIDLGTRQLRAFEALARWTHPELGPISPAEFIPIAEQINVIGQIGARLLGKAAAQAALWPEPVRLSFNLSAVELCCVSSARKVLRIIEEQGLDPTRLQIEVTETSLLADFEAARQNLSLLRKAGAHIVLDDFGAGYASIAYLREINFDAIKLDGGLVTSATDTDAGLRLLRGVLELCASLGVPCVAEHLEDERQVEQLRKLKCRYGQGYAFSVPLEAEAAREFAAAKLLRFPVAKSPPLIGRRAA
jgi:diguanylate cyclase (GGDEF)-like protein